MGISVWELALGGSVVVVITVIAAVVILGLRALDRANEADVPLVTDSIMTVLRDGRRTVPRRIIPSPTTLGSQYSPEREEMR
ncbi:hypothetical protein [Streptomyces sp. NPDC004286]|uniref:hypothetical protein n=1 Tax=Streptomyces sp. NPDC004286 TaxID=3364696 RepID=UPI00369EE9BE